MSNKILQRILKPQDSGHEETRIWRGNGDKNVCKACSEIDLEIRQHIIKVVCGSAIAPLQ